MPTGNPLIRIAAVLVLLMCADVATADQKLYSMSASARRFTGELLTLPIGSAPVATGGVLGQITTGVDAPPTLQVWDAQLDRPMSPATDLLFQGNPAFGESLQLKTSLAVQVPPRNVLVEFKVSGRSGPPTLSFCPGGTDPATGKTVFNGVAPYNPNCTVIASEGAGGIGLTNGRMRYTKTERQFGGLGALAAQGTFELAVMIVPIPPGTPTTDMGFGQVGFAGDILSGSGVGDPIDAPGDVATFDEGLVIKKLLGYTSQGLITDVGGTLAALPSVTQTSWGGNLTTGKVEVTVTDASPPQTFVLTGSDTRTPGGIGNITMVSGAISRTSLTGGSRNHDTISFTITPEPTMLAGAGVAFVTLVGAHRLTRRKRKTN